MVSAAGTAESTGESEGLGSSRRRPEPGAPGVLGKSRRSHRLGAPRTWPEGPTEGRISSSRLASYRRRAGRAGRGTFSVWLGRSLCTSSGGLRSGAPPTRVLPEAPPSSPQSAPQELAGCPVRPPGSKSRVPGTAGICLRTLVRVPGRLAACARVTASPLPFTRSEGGGSSWPGRAFGKKHRVLCGRRGRRGSLSRRDSVSVYGHREGRPGHHCVRPWGRAWGEPENSGLGTPPALLLVPEGIFTLGRKPRR